MSKQLLKFNITKYLLDANQDSCPLIELEVACNMTTHEQIRRFPSKYERLSCRRILQFVGDDPDRLIFYPLSPTTKMKLNKVIFHLLDEGWGLARIGNFLNSYHEEIEA